MAMRFVRALLWNARRAETRLAGVVDVSVDATMIGGRMITRQIALVSETSTQSVPPGQLMKVAAALQKQATQDLGPIWEVKATVDPFASLDDVPVGYWPLILVDDVPNAAGVHLDSNGQPYALAELGPDWPLTASHECLEMLVDPFGNKLRTGRSPKPGQGTVEFLVEVCDPSEDIEFGYDINGVRVSDFYTPEYFADTRADGVRYSFTGALREPRKVLQNGYLSWHDPVSNHWWQERFFSTAPEFKDLDVFTASRKARSIRSWIYTQTFPDRQAAAQKSAATRAARQPGLTAAASAPNPRAARLRAEIQGWKTP